MLMNGTESMRKKQGENFYHAIEFSVSQSSEFRDKVVLERGLKDELHYIHLNLSKPYLGSNIFILWDRISEKIYLIIFSVYNYIFH